MMMHGEDPFGLVPPHAHDRNGANFACSQCWIPPVKRTPENWPPRVLVEVTLMGDDSASVTIPMTEAEHDFLVRVADALNEQNVPYQPNMDVGGHYIRKTYGDPS